MDLSHLFFSDQNFAVVLNTVTSSDRGRIRYQNTDWFACTLSAQPIVKGALVELIERRGNTWLVSPYGG